ncbi:MAG: hypothetical protein MUP22_14580 [Desulfobacterales bacterium]|nr:hypothetical protein [Desulfobacterales bacterium]
MVENNKKDKVISYEDRKGYLYAFMTGVRDGVGDAIEYWRQILKECNKRGYRKVLVEQQFDKPLSTMGAFTLVEELLEMIVIKTRIAFVDRDATQNDINMFTETVAVNRGIFVRVFTNINDAVNWLEKDE